MKPETKALLESIRAELLKCTDEQLSRIIDPWMDAAFFSDESDKSLVRLLLVFGYQVQAVTDDLDELVTPPLGNFRQKITQMSLKEVDSLCQAAHLSMTMDAEAEGEKRPRKGQEFLSDLVSSLGLMRTW